VYICIAVRGRKYYNEGFGECDWIPVNRQAVSVKSTILTIAKGAQIILIAIGRGEEHENNVLRFALKLRLKLSIPCGHDGVLQSGRGRHFHYP
jgi:hypothetical protein